MGGLLLCGGVVVGFCNILIYVALIVDFIFMGDILEQLKAGLTSLGLCIRSF